MQIDIIVDTICPWCYIGKARFEKALAMRPMDGLVIGWRPFQLNPQMPPEGRDRLQYVEEKFGSARRIQRVYGNLEEVGRGEGIDFRFESIERTPNTIDSHRLIGYAGREGLQDDVVEALFRAYFTDGRDIGDADVLADIGAAAGLDRTELLGYLVGDRDRDAVAAEDERARDLGVTDVPCYVIERKYAVSGAQSPEVFLQVFDLARQDSGQVAAE